ncbi:astacin (Peptidase family m12A) domain-containing protein [Ditylenchus destructor]|nr:astacin (Peptidase family m12A) domain-containing protein [Ditylenchus destructor]
MNGAILLFLGFVTVRGSLGRIYNSEVIRSKRAGLKKDSPKRWTQFQDKEKKNYVIPYSIEPPPPAGTLAAVQFDQDEFNAIRTVMNTIESASCIQFVMKDEFEKESGAKVNQYLDFRKVAKGCEVHLGRPLTNQPSEVKLAENCLVDSAKAPNKRKLTRVLLNALGMSEEELRPDRDQYVEIVKTNIKPGFEKFFDTNNPNEFDTYNQPYNFHSVMHSESDIFLKSSEKNKNPRQVTIKVTDPKHTGPIGTADAMSQSDFEILNAMYQCQEL